MRPAQFNSCLLFIQPRKHLLYRNWNCMSTGNRFYEYVGTCRPQKPNTSPWPYCRLVHLDIVIIMRSEVGTNNHSNVQGSRINSMDIYKCRYSCTHLLAGLGLINSLALSLNLQMTTDDCPITIGINERDCQLDRMILHWTDYKAGRDMHAGSGIELTVFCKCTLDTGSLAKGDSFTWLEGALPNKCPHSRALHLGLFSSPDTNEITLNKAPGSPPWNYWSCPSRRWRQTEETPRGIRRTIAREHLLDSTDTVAEAQLH